MPEVQLTVVLHSMTRGYEYSLKPIPILVPSLKEHADPNFASGKISSGSKTQTLGKPSRFVDLLL
jgi:hypothetical protein